MGDENLRISRIKDAITAIPDFPKPGVVFRDIFPLFKDPAMLSDTISLMVEHIKDNIGSVDVIVGLEARGFLFGPMIAIQLGCSFTPIRKKGKLPGKCIQTSYVLEYGTDVIEAQTDSIKPGQNVVIVDDLLATGGTMSAAEELVSKMDGKVAECLVLIELVGLNGVAKLKHPFFSLLQF